MSSLPSIPVLRNPRPPATMSCISTLWSRRVEICQLVASVWRQDGQASFDLPDLGEETDAPVTYYLYAIVEAASTAGTPTLSAAEGATKSERKENRFTFPKCSGVDVVKQQDKKYRNINRRVSRSVFVGAVTMNCNRET